MLRDLLAVFSTSFTLKSVISVILLVLGFLFDALLLKVFLILIVLTLIDCTLGYIRAFMEKKAIASRVMRRYMWKFAGYMIAASSLFLMSNAMPVEIQFLTGWLDQFALAFFAVHEAISIIEHLNELGVPLPTRLLGNLKKVRDAADGDIDKFAEVKVSQQVSVDGVEKTNKETIVNVPTPKV